MASLQTSLAVMTLKIVLPPDRADVACVLHVTWYAVQCVCITVVQVLILYEGTLVHVSKKCVWSIQVDCLVQALALLAGT